MLSRCCDNCESHLRYNCKKTYKYAKKGDFIFCPLDGSKFLIDIEEEWIKQ